MAQKITITITTGNSAFADGGVDDNEPGPGQEVGRILRRVADDLQEDTANGDRILRDYNGNRCGTVRIRSARN